MTNSILDTSLLRTAKPWWYPFLSLSVLLYGIVVLGWNMQPIVVMFWWETILMSAAALIRAFFALDGRSFFFNLLQKLFFLFGGTLMFGAMIMLAVTFSIKVFDKGVDTAGYEKIPGQTNVLIFGYVMGLALHYFANGRYKTASPMGELMQTMVHLLILLTLLMVLAMHLIPAFPQLDQARWVGLAVVLTKFVVDLGFNRLSR